MTTDELVARYQLLADDAVGSARLSDESIMALLLEAEKEAAIRARLIHESDDPAMCRLAVVSGTASVALDPALYEITHSSFVDENSTRYPLKLVSTEWLDGLNERVSPAIDAYDPPSSDDWRDLSGVPVYAVQTDRKLRLVPTPDRDGTLNLEGYRTPIREADDDPEISDAHHEHLVQWVIYRRFSITDEDHFDGKRADVALAEFERYFGPRPDADLRRLTRHDTPHHVEAFFI